MKSFTFISEIYRLLGDVSDDAIEDALKEEIPPDIRAIVEAILRARRGNRTSPDPIAESEPAGAEGDYLPLSFILRGSLTGDEIISALNRSGLAVEKREKESRYKLVRRAERALEKLPELRRQRLLTRIRRSLAVDELDGWTKVIRSS